MIEFLKEGDVIGSIPLRVLVSNIYQGQTTKGDTFVNVKLQDKTGILDWMMWDTSREELDFVEGDIFDIIGSVVSYQGKLQVRITEKKKVDGDPIKFLPGVSSAILATMKLTLSEWLNKVKSPYKELLTEVFVTNTKFCDQFCMAPAAQIHHNAFLGGLLDHTLSVTHNANALMPDNDLLITAALLHDIGKVSTYQVTPVIDMTMKGALLNHIVLAMQLVPKIISKVRKSGVDFPAETETFLLHCIAAHQGKKEWGSPVEPMIKEAIVLHHADLLVSRLETFYTEIDKVTPGKSAYSQAYKGFIFNRR